MKKLEKIRKGTIESQLDQIEAKKHSAVVDMLDDIFLTMKSRHIKMVVFMNSVNYGLRYAIGVSLIEGNLRIGFDNGDTPCALSYILQYDFICKVWEQFNKELER